MDPTVREHDVQGVLSSGIAEPTAGPSMTKAELIERIARSRDLPPEITKKAIDTILGLAFEEIGLYFAKAKVTRNNSPRFTFPRFGTFTKKRRSARKGVNPRTLEPMQIEACDTIDFRVSRDLREAMNGGTAGTVSKRSTKSTAKRKVKSRSRKVAKSPASDTAVGPGRRRLTPRDEDAELDELIPNEAMFDEVETLPSAPLKRIRGRKATRSRSGNGS